LFDPASVFLLIFLVSFGLTLAMFLLGVVGVPLHGHGVDHGGIHVGHMHTDVQHVGGHGGPHIHGPEVHGGTESGGPDVSPFNMATILAFLTWFGGTGYLMVAHFGLGTIVGLGISSLVGLVGAGLMFLFIARVLLPGQTPYLRSEDYELVGTVGKLTVGIREGGTGELVFSKGGTRRVISARSDDGSVIPRGTEVAIVRHERGIAYVETFAELLAEEELEKTEGV